MSKFHPPEAFQFHKPTEWPAWRERFSRFRLATKLNKEDGIVQVSALIYAMGPEAEYVFTSFVFAPRLDDDHPAESNENYDTVLRKFNEHFVPKRNVIHERGRFTAKVQDSGETVEEFVRRLYELVEHCDYGDKKNEFLRDRIVIGLADKELSERLQLRETTSLEDAIQMARQSELVKIQMSLQPAAAKNLQEIRAGASAGRGGGQNHRGGHKKHWKQGQGRKQQQRQDKDTDSGCGRCGRKPPHPDPSKCPAKHAECHKCHKQGRYALKCR